MRYVVAKLGDLTLVEDFKRFENLDESIEYFNNELCNETKGFELDHDWMNLDMKVVGVSEINSFCLVDMEHNNDCDPYGFLKRELISLF